MDFPQTLPEVHRHIRHSREHGSQKGKLRLDLAFPLGAFLSRLSLPADVKAQCFSNDSGVVGRRNGYADSFWKLLEAD